MSRVIIQLALVQVCTVPDPESVSEGKFSSLPSARCLNKILRTIRSLLIFKMLELCLSWLVT